MTAHMEAEKLKLTKTLYTHVASNVLKKQLERTNNERNGEWMLPETALSLLQRCKARADTIENDLQEFAHRIEILDKLRAQKQKQEDIYACEREAHQLMKNIIQRGKQLKAKTVHIDKYYDKFTNVIDEMDQKFPYKENKTIWNVGISFDFV